MTPMVRSAITGFYSIMASPSKIITNVTAIVQMKLRFLSVWHQRIHSLRANGSSGFVTVPWVSSESVYVQVIMKISAHAFRSSVLWQLMKLSLTVFSAKIPMARIAQHLISMFLFHSGMNVPHYRSSSILASQCLKRIHVPSQLISLQSPVIPFLPSPTSATRAFMSNLRNLSSVTTSILPRLH